MLLFSTSRFVKLKICKIAVKMLIRGCQTHVKCNVQYSIWKGIPNPQFRVQCSSHRNLVFNSVRSYEIINIQILFVKLLHSKMNFPAKNPSLLHDRPSDSWQHLRRKYTSFYDGALILQSAHLLSRAHP